MEEVLKDIPGYEGRYKISSYGRVFSCKIGNFMSLKNNTNGYPAVLLCKQGKKHYVTVHRLVAKAFIPNPNNYPCVNHKDETRDNNNVENLEWCTTKYNINYGTCKEKIARKRYGNRHAIERPVYQIDKQSGEIINEFSTIKYASKVTGINRGNICLVCRNKILSAGGYYWRYQSDKVVSGICKFK